MIPVVMRLDTTPERFVTWLGEHTKHLPDKGIPTCNGYIALQRAYPYTPIGNLSRVVIQGIPVYTQKEPDPDRGGFPLDYITYDLIPLASERTEITARCWSDESAVTNYFNQLGAEIRQTWPEARNELVLEIDRELAEIKTLMGADNGKDELEPWEKIDDHLWDRVALKLWREGYTCGEIENKTHVASEARIRNRLSELRAKYGTETVPTDRQRSKKKIVILRDSV